jgi:hypothetical protein
MYTIPVLAHRSLTQRLQYRYTQHSTHESAATAPVDRRIDLVHERSMEDGPNVLYVYVHASLSTGTWNLSIFLPFSPFFLSRIIGSR